MNDAAKFVSKIYSEHCDSLLNFCRYIIFNDPKYSDLIEETVQETFILAMERYDTLKDHPNVEGWLRETSKKKISSELKKSRSRAKRHAFSVDNESSLTIADTDDLIQQAIDKNYVYEIVLKLKSQLTEKELIIFETFFIQKKSIMEISNLTKQKPNSIKAMIHRIREKAKKIKKENFIFLLTFLLLKSYYI